MVMYKIDRKGGGLGGRRGQKSFFRTDPIVLVYVYKLDYQFIYP